MKAQTAVLAPWDFLIVQPELRPSGKCQRRSSDLLAYLPELYNQILITGRLYIKAEICQVTIGVSILDSH